MVKNILYQGKPLVSIVVNCLNCSKYLLEALKSIEKQTYPNIELIFVDNCSTDNSAEILSRVNMNVQYLKLKSIIPLYAARNEALNLVNGYYVAFLDSDDIWEETKISEQLEIFDEDTILVYCKRKFIDENGEIINKVDSKKYKGRLVNKLLLSPFIPMSSVILKSKVAKLLYFNPSFNLIGDFDMWLRVAMQGKIAYVDKILLLDRLHSDSTGQIHKSSWIKERRSLYCDFFRNYRLKYLGLIVFILRTEVRYFLTVLGLK